MNGSVSPNVPVSLPQSISPDRYDIAREVDVTPEVMEMRRRADAVAGQYSPPFVVVDPSGIVLLRSDRVGRYVMPSQGSTSPQLRGLAHQDLRGALNDVLDRAVAEQTPVRIDGIHYATDGLDGSVTQGRVDIVIEAMPCHVGMPAQFAVLFIEVSGRTDELGPDGSASADGPGLASAAASSTEMFQLMASIVPAFLFTTGLDLRVTGMNEPFYQYTGMTRPTLLANGWSPVIHPDDLDDHQNLWQAALQQGREFQQEHRLRAADGSWRWFLSRSVPQHDAQGRVVRWFGSAVDIQQRRSSERSQRLLLAEVQHRAKNILAVVRSLLSRTLETAVDLNDFAAHLSGRISALARAQTALGRTIEGHVSLDELAHQEVVAHGGQVRDQVTIEGPTVMLTDKVAETLGLALHELTTNALKFGALSTPDGEITITWKASIVECEPMSATRLNLVWEETGMTLPPDAPLHSGFGRELIERGLPYELGALTELDFRETGVRCVIELTLKAPPEGEPLLGDAT